MTLPETVPAEPTIARSDRAPLRDAVAASASTLQDRYLGMRGEGQKAPARGRLAELRRSAGSTPQQRPLALQEVLDSLMPGLHDDDLGRGDAPSPSERAAFAAMTLFALHMQSAKAPMHVRGRSFGAAVGMLRTRTESGSLKPRFDAMLSSRDERSRLTHARSLITLLRGEKIGLDYGMLAADLRTLASAHRAGVLLRWGRDFAMTPRRENEKSTPSAPVRPSVPA